MGKIEREKEIVAEMVAVYCRGRHGEAELCPQCMELLKYAHHRLEVCRYGEGKPACRRCETHCYGPVMRREMREVMIYSGKKMLWRHPYVTLRHLLNL